MSVVPFEEYFPMAEGPGAGADRWRWRRMARLWSDSGVVRRPEAANMLHFHGWVEPGMVALSPGAVWVNGHYGETPYDRWLSTPGDDGMVMAVLDPYQKTVRLEWGPGIHGDMDRFNGWDDHYWQIGLWELNGFGNVVDVRRFIPPERQLPPLVEVPAFVPRPFFAAHVGSGLVNVGTGATWVTLWYPAGEPGFVPGRNYRVTWYFYSPFQRNAANWGGLSNAECTVDDAQGARARIRAYNDSLQPAVPSGTYQLPSRTVSAAFANLDGALQIGVLAWTTQNFTSDDWQPSQIRIELTDVGSGAVAG
jgi:hypothetical protein